MQAKAQERILEQQAARLLEAIWDEDAAPVLNPVAALQQLTGRLQHAANALGARLSAADLDGPTSVAWLRVVRELRQALEGMERLDLDAKEVQIKRETAEFITAAFRGGVGVLPVGLLTPADRDLMVREFMRLLGRNTESVPAALGAGGAS